MCGWAGEGGRGGGGERLVFWMICFSFSCMIFFKLDKLVFLLLLLFLGGGVGWGGGGYFGTT